MQLELALPATADGIAEARRALGELVDGRVDEETAADLRLILSELLANCVAHAGLADDDAVALEIAVDDERVRIEVSDGGIGFTLHRARHPDAEAVSGRGLLLVEELADRWGMHREDQRTHVWAEIVLRR
jgi:anti-sigma regulatory factor (Ser/Thr protein kinase)